jgi:solute carrier family 35 protein F5
VQRLANHIAVIQRSKMDGQAGRLAALREALGLGGADPRRARGLLLVVLVAVIWVGSSYVVQGIEASGASPWVLTYIANSLFAVALPLAWLHARLRRRAAAAAAGAGLLGGLGGLQPGAGLASVSYDQYAAVAAADEGDAGGAPPPEGGKAAAAPEPEWRRLLRAAAVVAPLWYGAQLTFNASLALSSVTSNTILSSTSAVFTFLFATAAGRERFSAAKLACVGALVAGTAAVALADARGDAAGGGSGAAPLAGDALCLASAALYGAYTLAIQRALGGEDGGGEGAGGADEGPGATLLFFGCMGALIAAGVGAPLAAAWAAGAPLGSLSPRAGGLAVAKGLFDNVLSDFLWARAIVLVGPTLATAGLSLQVPLAAAADAALGRARWARAPAPALLTFVGAGAVVGGFLGLTLLSEPAGAARRRELAEARWERQLAAAGVGDFGEGAGGGVGGLPPPRADRRLTDVPLEVAPSI